MPYEWDIPPDPDRAPAEGEPLARLHAWPYRSLPRTGFVGVMGMGFLLLLVPVFAFIGTWHLWWMLASLMAALLALWYFLEKSYRDAEILEELTLWPERIHLVRHGPRGQHKEWEANPHWVVLTMHPTGGPVPDYLTLRGEGREVEIGAFLSEEERPALHDDIARALVLAKTGR